MVLSTNAAGDDSVFGFRIPARFATHVELVLVHLFMPHAPLLANLSGMIAGRSPCGRGAANSLQRLALAGAYRHCCRVPVRVASGAPSPALPSRVHCIRLELAQAGVSRHVVVGWLPRRVHDALYSSLRSLMPAEPTADVARDRANVGCFPAPQVEDIDEADLGTDEDEYEFVSREEVDAAVRYLQ
eukprot:scaffold1523_cov426-Prasinococcus_capsulatus_cf.AAC.4